MDEKADVVVVGAGLLGLATAYALRGRREVVVLEAAEVGHARGGSHGPSRIFRLGYADELYVRMALRARDTWHELEEAAGAQLLHPTGQLTFGSGRRAVFDALTACGAPVEFLPDTDVRERFPMFAGHGSAVFEPESSVIAADRVLDALQTTARCEVRTGARVIRLDDRIDGVRIETDGGTINARVAVVCAGAASADLVPAVATYATLEHVAYLSPKQSGTTPPPIFITFDDPPVYGLPTPRSDRYKIALHHAGAFVDLDRISFAPDEHAVAVLVDAARRWLPAFDADTAEIDVCPYDNTPDEDFVLDRIDNVVVGAGTSGHGFKFGPLLGALLADLVCGDAPAVPLDRFSAYRLGHGDP